MGEELPTFDEDLKEEVMLLGDSRLLGVQGNIHLILKSGKNITGGDDFWCM